MGVRIRRLAVAALALLLLWLVLRPSPVWGLETGEAPRGERLFANHCSGCHLHGGNVVRRSRTLRMAALRRNGIDGPAAIARIAAGGIGRMGGYDDVLGEGGAQAVGEWVWQQAQAGWPRP
ncbi:MAG: c-type cytochrome [Synechococcaceae cyanobacterium]|nr:c-type cytochrome [Synechococcaceae cyanobacterium]